MGSAAELAHHRVIAKVAGGAAVDTALVTDAVRHTTPLLGDGAHVETVSAILAAASGLGPLETFLQDPAVTDVMVNGDGRVWIESSGSLIETAAKLSHAQTLRLIERVVAPLGLRVDRLNAAVDARLADGSRVHAMVPPLAVDGPCLTIRRVCPQARSVGDFASPEVAELLTGTVRRGANIVVSGGTGTGKTTLLNALAASIPTGERVVTIEDVAELRLEHSHVVRLETRPPSAEGIAAVTARDLVREALRMRPDRIIVGECRGGEALDMVMAMNTGHAGSMSTCHANDPEGALRRLAMLCVFGESGLPLDAARAEVSSAVDVVVQVARDQGGARRVESVSAVVDDGLDYLVAAGAIVDGEVDRRWR